MGEKNNHRGLIRLRLAVLRRDREDTEGGKERPGASIVEPRWGSVVWVIGDPACAARPWALEFNAVGVKGGFLGAIRDFRGQLSVLIRGSSFLSLRVL